MLKRGTWVRRQEWGGGFSVGKTALNKKEYCWRHLRFMCINGNTLHRCTKSTSCMSCILTTHFDCTPTNPRIYVSALHPASHFYKFSSLVQSRVRHPATWFIGPVTFAAHLWTFLQHAACSWRLNELEEKDISIVIRA
jgi:hypothetical protein